MSTEKMAKDSHAKEREIFFESLHERQVPPVKSGLRVTHLIMEFPDLGDKERIDIEIEFLCQYFREAKNDIKDNKKTVIYTLPLDEESENTQSMTTTFKWAYHQAFSTYTFFSFSEDRSSKPPSVTKMENKFIEELKGIGCFVDMMNIEMTRQKGVFLQRHWSETNDFQSHENSQDVLEQRILEQMEKIREEKFLAMDNNDGEATIRAVELEDRYNLQKTRLSRAREKLKEAEKQKGPLRGSLFTSGIQDLETIFYDLEGTIHRHQAQSIIGATNLWGNYATWNQNASVWTSFLLQGDKNSVLDIKHVKFFIFENDLRPQQCSRLIQLILDIWTYSILALRSIKACKNIFRKLKKQEKVNEHEAAEQKNKLKRPLNDEENLSLLVKSQELVKKYYGDLENRHLRIVPAYVKIIKERFVQLDIKQIHGTQGIQSFLLEHLEPGVDFCENIEKRLKIRSKHNTNDTDLIRTKVNQNIQEQNLKLLVGLRDASRNQLEMQKVVEFISVVPLTYYTFSFLKSAFGIGQWWVGIMIFFGFALFLIYRFKKSHTSEDNKDAIGYDA